MERKRNLNVPIANVTAVVRSVDERTTAACTELIQQCIQNVVVINERPFTTAIIKAFEIGLHYGHPWTLCIDADVLIHAPAIVQLIQIAEQQPDTTFELQGNVLDKFFGVPRPAGIHLYRTELLPTAIPNVPIQNAPTRPETFLLNTMAAAGYPWQQVDLLCGLHDYEQYYRDIYRKTFVHARKHRHNIPYLHTLWQRLAPTDPDYQMALWGLQAGILHTGHVTIDVSDFPQRVQQHLMAQGWSEKEALSSTNETVQRVEHILTTYMLPPEYEPYETLRQQNPKKVTQMSRHLRRQIIVDQIGWFRFISWLITRGIYRLRKPIGPNN